MATDWQTKMVRVFGWFGSVCAIILLLWLLWYYGCMNYFVLLV